MPDTTFPGQLKALREKAGLTQQQLADRVRVTQVTVARWETGTRSPSWATVCRLADALGVKADDFRRG